MKTVANALLCPDCGLIYTDGSMETGDRCNATLPGGDCHGRLKRLTRAKVGEPFPCPHCGESDWKADYYQAVNQGIGLIVGEDGMPEEGEYDGCEDTYDDGCSENERYVCNACRHAIVFGEFRFTARQNPVFTSEL